MTGWLMVGHLLEYHPGMQKLKELTESGELGDQIYYIYGNRLNLGKLRADENALWSLGAHDVSVVLMLAGEEPSEVVAHVGRMSARGRGRRLLLHALSFGAVSPSSPSRGSTRTRSGASRSSDRGAWRRSTTWRSRES